MQHRSSDITGEETNEGAGRHSIVMMPLFISHRVLCTIGKDPHHKFIAIC